MAFIINSIIVPDLRDALLMSCVITLFSVNNLKLGWKTGKNEKISSSLSALCEIWITR